MKLVLKKVMVTFLCAVITLQVVGCGLIGGFDAKEYVKVQLDAIYLGQYDAYAKMFDMEIEDAVAEMEGVRESEVQSLRNEIPSLSQEHSDRIAVVIGDLFKSANFEVLEAVKTDTGYSVPIKILPSNFYAVFGTTLEEMMMEKLEAGIDLSTDEALADLVVEAMEKALSDSSYSEETEITIAVEKDESGAWDVSERDLMLIHNTLFPQ